MPVLLFAYAASACQSSHQSRNEWNPVQPWLLTAAAKVTFDMSSIDTSPRLSLSLKTSEEVGWSYRPRVSFRLAD